jgi:hypothetical protein
MQRHSVLQCSIALVTAACGMTTGPEYAVEISIADSVVARRGPGEMNLTIPIKLKNLDSRLLFYEEGCGHALQRRDGSSWRLVQLPPCVRQSPYSVSLDPGQSYQFTFRVRVSLPSDLWPAVGAGGEYRMILWLTSTPSNLYGFPPRPLAVSSRISPTFSIREEEISY